MRSSPLMPPKRIHPLSRTLSTPHPPSSSISGECLSAGFPPTSTPAKASRCTSPALHSSPSWPSQAAGHHQPESSSSPISTMVRARVPGADHAGLQWKRSVLSL